MPARAWDAMPAPPKLSIHPPEIQWALVLAHVQAGDPTMGVPTLASALNPNSQ